jgi:hypothetical protein
MFLSLGIDVTATGQYWYRNEAKSLKATLIFLINLSISMEMPLFPLAFLLSCACEQTAVIEVKLNHKLR